MTEPHEAQTSRLDPIVHVRDLGKRFQKRKSWGQLLRDPLSREYADALCDLSLEIRRGEFFGILGPNGAGKTTLFKILATLVLPDRGSAYVDGHEVTGDAASVRDILTPVIAEERSLFWRLSAEENLRLFAALYNLPDKVAMARVSEVLEIIGLSDADKKLVGAFSSGMKQRLLIGRALLSRPKVLLLDEPTRSLDPLAARDLRKFLREELVGTYGVTAILATHSPDEALHLCDRVSVLNRGRLLAVGTVDELLRVIGSDTYQVLSKPALQPILAQLCDVGRITSVSSRSADIDGWTLFELRVSGGTEEAARILQDVCGSGIPVAEFQRKPLGLAEILDDIIKGADHA